MARAIDADEMLKEILSIIEFRKQHYMDVKEYESFAKFIEQQPTLEVETVKHGYVPKEVLEQIQWERDVAIDQLNSYGVQFGEKADVQKVKHGEWRGWGKGGTYNYENYGTCSVCHEDAEIGTKYRNYCPNCGARMRVNKND